MGPFLKCLNLSLCLLLAACAWQPNDPLKTSVRPDIMGVDISKYQGDVDFKQLKASGITYVFIRASEGNTYQDPKFESHFSQAKAAGLIVSAYHFYETNDAPNSQLDNFTQLVTLSTGDLPPVVDIERLHQQDDTQLSENLQVYLNGLESHYGVKPIIYTGLNFANQHITRFSHYPLWLAEYGRAEPTLPTGWSQWTFWQWSQSHVLKGIDGKVDADKFNGDAHSFAKLLIK
jgi:lysozyme